MPEITRGIEQPPEITNTRRRAEKKRDFNYEEFWDRLRIEDENGYEYYWTPEHRKAYTEQGVEFLVDIRREGVDTIVFMDKSARPLAGFFHALSKRIYPDQKSPAIRFIVGMRATNPELVDKIKHLFDKSVDVFRGKSVLFVDEETAGGDTLRTMGRNFQKAFPDIKDVLLGALSYFDYQSRENQPKLDIKPPQGSYYRDKLGEYRKAQLGSLLYYSKYEGLTSREAVVKEIEGEIITKAVRGVSVLKTWGYPLRQVGKYETLDEKSLEGIDDRIKKVGIKEEKERLKKIKEAYEKLLPNE